MKNLKIIISFLAIILLFGSIRAQTGESLYEKTIRAEALNNQAVKKVDEEKYAEAIELFRQAISLRPDYAIAYGNLGATFYRTGQFEEAITALKKAIQLDPALAEAHYRLGVVYSDLGKSDESVEFLKQAIKLNQNFAVAFHDLGCVYIRQQKFKEAVASLERATELEPDNAENYILSGFALSQQKKYGEAIRQIEKAVTLTPQDAEAQFFLGQLYLLNHDKQLALVQYRKLTAFDMPIANKLYAVIYSNLLVTANKK